MKWKSVHVPRRLFSTTIKRLFETSRKPTCNLNPNSCHVVPCCMKALTAPVTSFSSAPCLLPEVEDSVWTRVVQYR